MKKQRWSDLSACSKSIMFYFLNNTEKDIPSFWILTCVGSLRFAISGQEFSSVKLALPWSPWMLDDPRIAELSWASLAMRMLAGATWGG